MKLVLRSDTGAGSEVEQGGRTIVEASDAAGLDVIDDHYRGARLEAILADGDGIVLSFRGDHPDLFVKPATAGLARWWAR